MEGNTFLNITLSFWTDPRPSQNQNIFNGSHEILSAKEINNDIPKSDWSSNNNSNNHNNGSDNINANLPYVIDSQKKTSSLLFLFGTNNNNTNNNSNIIDNNKTHIDSNVYNLTNNDIELINRRNSSNSNILFNHHHHLHHHYYQSIANNNNANNTISTAIHTHRNISNNHVSSHSFLYTGSTNNKTKQHNNLLTLSSSASHHQDDSIVLYDDLPSMHPISDFGDSNEATISTVTTTINQNESGSWTWSNLTDSNDSIDYWKDIFYLDNNNNHTIGISDTTTSDSVWNKARSCIGANKFHEACLMKVNGTTVTDADNSSNFTSAFDQMEHERVYWALVLVILPILALFGNFLVILSVYRERSLQTVTNWFIVSLAFADLFVTIPMLFCTYVMVNVDWELSELICDLYIAIDVICSTASIFNLVAISFDRYIAVTHPIFYSKHKNDKRVVITIVLVWMASFGVGLPIMLGANTSPERIPELCIFYNSDFIIYSSLWSFYVPCLIMVILYYKIFKAIHDRARKKMDHMSSSGSKNKSTVFSNSNNNNKPSIINQTNKAKNILGIDNKTKCGSVIDNLSLNKQLQIKSGNVMKLEQIKVPIEEKNHNHTSIALISEININVSNDNSNNTESHLDEEDDDEEDDDDMEEEQEAIEIKNVVRKCSNKLVTSELHCSTTTISNNNNNNNSSIQGKCQNPENNEKPNLNETNFNDPKLMGAEIKNKNKAMMLNNNNNNNSNNTNNKCDMFLVENSARALKPTTIADNKSNKNSSSSYLKCPKLEIKSINATTNNGITDNNVSTSGSTSGTNITTTTTTTSKTPTDNKTETNQDLDYDCCVRNDNNNNNNNNNEDDDEDDDAMNPDIDNEDNDLTVTTTITNVNARKKNTLAQRILQQQQLQQQKVNTISIDNDDSKKKSRFNLGRKHKSSRKNKKREKVSARRERKATKTLAIVLGVFLLCWTPFFSCNIWDAICIKLHENHFIRSDCRPGMTAFLLTTWLGYMNSCANPLIYTIFNTVTEN